MKTRYTLRWSNYFGQAPKEVTQAFGTLKLAITGMAAWEMLESMPYVGFVTMLLVMLVDQFERFIGKEEVV